MEAILIGVVLGISTDIVGNWCYDRLKEEPKPKVEEVQKKEPVSEESLEPDEDLYTV